jgi:hypothetical protein
MKPSLQGHLQGKPQLSENEPGKKNPKGELWAGHKK